MFSLSDLGPASSTESLGGTKPPPCPPPGLTPPVDEGRTGLKATESRPLEKVRHLSLRDKHFTNDTTSTLNEHQNTFSNSDHRKRGPVWPFRRRGLHGCCDVIVWGVWCSQQQQLSSWPAGALGSERQPSGPRGPESFCAGETSFHGAGADIPVS